MVLYRGPSAQAPLPPRYSTTFRAVFQGYIAVGAAATNSYTLNLSTQTHPLAGFASLDVVLVDAGSSTFANYNCAGFSELCAAGALYTKYRPYACKVRFAVLPQSTNDTQTWTFLPTANTGISLPTSSMQAQAQPFAKAHIYSSSNVIADNIFEHTYHYHEHWGVSLQTFMTEDDFSSDAGTAPLNNTQIKIYRADGGNSTMANACPVRGEFTYYVSLEAVNSNLSVS